MKIFRNIDFEEIIVTLSRLKILGYPMSKLTDRLHEIGRLEKDALLTVKSEEAREEYKKDK